jgi:hypothetical protein
MPTTRIIDHLSEPRADFSSQDKTNHGDARSMQSGASHDEERSFSAHRGGKFRFQLSNTQSTRESHELKKVGKGLRYLARTDRQILKESATLLYNAPLSVAAFV